MTAPLSGPERLDHFVQERLALLRMTRDELSRRGGPQRSTLRKAKAGSRTLQLATLTRLDEALGWAPGSSAGILKGGEPACSRPHDPQVRTVVEAAEDLIRESIAILADAGKLLSEIRHGDIHHAR